MGCGRSRTASQAQEGAGGPTPKQPCTPGTGKDSVVNEGEHQSNAQNIQLSGQNGGKANQQTLDDFNTGLDAVKEDKQKSNTQHVNGGNGEEWNQHSLGDIPSGWDAAKEDQQQSNAEHSQLNVVRDEEGSRKPLDDISSKLDDIVQQAIGSCEDHRMLQLFDAEKILMDAVDAIDVNNTVARHERLAALDTLRASKSYRDVFARLQVFEERVKFNLQSDDEIKAGEEWKLAASVPIDYKALGMELSPAADAAVAKEDRTIGIYHRTVDGKPHIRFRMVTPLKPANVDQSLNLLTVWNALITEFPLWHVFHPAVAGNGPIELTPKAPYYNLVQLLIKVLWIKIASISQEETMFNFDSGVQLLVMEDASPDSPLRSQYPPPAGFRMEDDVITSLNLVVPQRHTVFWSTVMVMDFKKPPPQWALSFF